MTLYAVAYNIRTREGWKPGTIQYVKADDAATAKAAVIRSHKARIDVIACAPAIGYFVEDKQGKVLST